MITNIIFMGIGSCIGGVVGVLLSSQKEKEINQRIEDAKRESEILTRNELNTIIKNQDLEIKRLKQNKTIDIEEI